MARPPDISGRDRILRTASRLFYLDGVRAVGMAQIIEAAGCGKNMLYRHFPSKADLAAAYLTATRERREREVASALAAAPDNPKDRLVALVAEVAARVSDADYRGCAFRNYLTEFPLDDDAPARVARTFIRDNRAQVDALADPPLSDRIWLLIDALYGKTHTDPQVAVAWARELAGRPDRAPET
ncbi:TetR/AcrR family transcriptional regulator [Actinoplanes sp. TBRC 11911]|uniref:TetR/AcrR family transcriptional regulator n=1 Tax=Actinoplanes sp. TBRC 11911 TaxID=2729386 RepID=UPI00145DDA84|nr:TetR/AcrR family transcriptional regulator [Actinoplanes sp. TBRC 11911]NMO51588.1 TetR/AcrR family transcriptional regulator [Actinoplanes sp. TBRC 11911]